MSDHRDDPIGSPNPNNGLESDPETTVGGETDNSPIQDDTEGDISQDEQIGRQLDQHLRKLRASGDSTPPQDPASSDREVHELRPVVDKLHQLSTYLSSSSELNTGPETVDYPDRIRPDQNRQQVGKYEVRKVLGSGGQAAAYLAFDPDLHRHVVLKVYKEIQSELERETVLAEGRSLARVRSPYVAQCFGAERERDIPYLVMEYVPGKDLRKAYGGSPADTQTALTTIEQAAEGLAAVHACGLIHRDIKSSNIILAEDGKTRLVDFGLATPLASEALRNRSGTFAYMSPEQARGEVERIDHRSDIFGLGAVFYELLTGMPPYSGTTPTEVHKQACAGEIVPPVGINAMIPQAVSELCMRCLAKHPSNRPASAAELIKALDEVSKSRGRFAASRNRWAISIAIAAVLLVSTWVFWPESSNQPTDQLTGLTGNSAGDSSVAHKERIPPTDELPKLTDQQREEKTTEARQLHGQGLELQAQGDYNGARALFEKALAIRSGVLGEVHIDTMNSRTTLARLLFMMGNYEEARTQYAAALKTTNQLIDQRGFYYISGPSQSKVRTGSSKTLSMQIDAQETKAQADPRFSILNGLALSCDALGEATQAKKHSENALGRELRRDFPLEFEIRGGKKTTQGNITVISAGNVTLRVKADTDCHIAIWQVDSNGVTQLFPNDDDLDTLVRASQPRLIPPVTGSDDQSAYSIEGFASEGPEYLHVLASDQPWEIEPVDKLDRYAVFATPKEKARWQEKLRGFKVVKKSTDPKRPLRVSELIVPFQVRNSP